MMILAVEQSSDTGSIAILNDDKILGERAWDGLVLRSSGLFACLKELLTLTKLSLTDISHYAVDIGPGSYSGLRISFAAVRAFALPDKKPVYALTSAEIMAWQAMKEYAADKIQVVGDARREQIWSCVFKDGGNIPVALSPLRLVPTDSFHPVEGAVVVSPDWHRLEVRLKAATAGKGRVIAERYIPTAGCLGKLLHRKMALNIDSEPLRLIYLHSAVKEK